MYKKYINKEYADLKSTAARLAEDMSRKSIALYYYTNGRPDHETLSGLESHDTIYKKRTEDRKFSAKKIMVDITPPILIRTVSKLFKHNG